MKAVVIASDSRAVEGFGAMGVEALLVSSREEARSAFISQLESRGDGSGTGTVLVAKSIYSYIEDLADEHRRRGILPDIMLLDC